MSAFGIDFGTTTSCAVETNGTSVDRFGDASAMPLPSIVAIDKLTGEASGGRAVWDKRFELERDGRYHVIRSIKPFLGTDHHWPTNARSWTVEDVASCVLLGLTARAKQLGLTDGIGAATFSVPVNTTARQKQALSRAAKRAGMSVNGFVSESTAAVCRYYNHVKHMRQIAVFGPDPIPWTG